MHWSSCKGSDDRVRDFDNSSTNLSKEFRSINLVPISDWSAAEAEIACHHTDDDSVSVS